MKKPLLLFLICLLSGMAFALQTSKKNNPITDNSAIKHSKKEDAKQAKQFQNDKRYSYLVNSRKAKALKKQQAKNGKG